MKEIDTDTLKLIPNVTPIPVFTDADAIKQAVKDIVHILDNPKKNNIPTILLGDKIRNAIWQVATFLKHNKNIPRPDQTLNIPPLIALPPPMEEQKKILKKLYNQHNSLTSHF